MKGDQIVLISYTLPRGENRDIDSRIEELIATMARGDVSAMGALYELIETDIYAYACSKGLNKEDAADITHDTFVQIWKTAAQYRSMGKPLAWIFTVERNLILRQFHSSRRFVPYDESAGEESDGGEFSQSVIDNEFLRGIMRVLDSEEREIICLHIVSGLKHREIAKLLGKPLSTVLSRYHRAMKKLRLQIQDKEEDANEQAEAEAEDPGSV